MTSQETNNQPQESNEKQTPVEVTQTLRFDPASIKQYPRSSRKVSIQYGAYTLNIDNQKMETGQSLFISPEGLEFHCHATYSVGMLLKININIPDYWQRKLRFVEYRRIDQPAQFPILAKVIKTEDIGRRGKKKLITVQTVNIDETDQMVLKSFLQDG